LAATWNRTSPSPCPDVGVRFVIQAACDEAVQAHSGCARMMTEELPPPAPIEVVAADAVTAHFAADGPVPSVADAPQAVAENPSATRRKVRSVRACCCGVFRTGRNDARKIMVTRPLSKQQQDQKKSD
jgi:hypothetical protein